MTEDACELLEPDPKDDVSLMVSELVTNAVVHGAGEIRLRIETDGAGVRVSVSDEGDGEVQAQEMPGPSVGRGRGLAIVAQLASRWGVTTGPEQGKTVWFEYALREP